MSKAALYFWLAAIPSIIAAPWVVAIYNDPSTLDAHTSKEWFVVMCITALQALYQGMVALRALGSNPNPNGKTPNETPPTDPPAPTGTV